MKTYVEFLEDHLGQIEYGWSRDSEGNEVPFQIVKYSEGPFTGTVTYSTLGMSNERLVSSVSKKQIRQELIFVSYSTFGDENIPGILQQVGLEALKTNNAYLRGDVIGPYGTLFEGSELEALYVTMPVYFPDSFHTFDCVGDLSIIQAWLVPITFDEAIFIKQYGWEEFEDMLVKVDPDLINFKRVSIIT
ncbi:suppressor of fused domain protein [Paenibacillus paeoniae]|uniref:Suppressor of fused domain protein n=1 Tax=Paenibacillus paeoniae TaxID=2292705 RepID=A0A371PHM0_9BACL|nr:suppressor of fused domain protein [Paenibacillus paeoniae]REK75634.1 suppressor of fused domain protein [Paenibacillus paeoniae]